MEETFGSFCGSNSTHYYLAAQQYAKAIYIFACVVSVIGSVSSTFGNTVIIFALRKCQSLHPPSKALLCSLALTDLFVGLVVLPLFVTYYLTIILEIPGHYCVIAVTYGRTSSFFGMVSFETIATISVDRLLAFHLRLRYQEVVKLKRVVGLLIIEWIIAAVWTGSWFLNGQNNMISGVIISLSCYLITLLCYHSIYRGLRLHVAQIQQQVSTSEISNFNVVRYKKTVNNMLWINGLLLVCYLPYLSSLFAILAMGLNNSTRFALHFSAIAIYLNSSLNPILYCWKINELREKVISLLRTLFNTSSNLQ